jgi:preprotein translocase subunit Sec63
MRWLFLLAVAWLVLRLLRRLPAPPRPQSGHPAEVPWDPHAVLGVPRGASRDAITRSYHDQLKRYHPDRVAELGEELQELAHRKTIELRRAYEDLTR